MANFSRLPKTDVNVVAILVLKRETVTRLNDGRSLGFVITPLGSGKLLHTLTSHSGLDVHIVETVFDSGIRIREDDGIEILRTTGRVFFRNFKGYLLVFNVSNSSKGVLVIVLGSRSREQHGVANRESRHRRQGHNDRRSVSAVVRLANNFETVECAVGIAGVAVHNGKEHHISAVFTIPLTSLVAIGIVFGSRKTEVHVLTGSHRFSDVVNLTSHTISGCTVSLETGSGKVFNLERSLVGLAFVLASILVERNHKGISLQITLTRVGTVDFFAIRTDKFDNATGVKHGTSSIHSLVVLIALVAITQLCVLFGGRVHLDDFVQFTLRSKTDDTSGSCWILDYGVGGIIAQLDSYTRRKTHFSSHSLPHGTFVSTKFMVWSRFFAARN